MNGSNFYCNSFVVQIVICGIPMFSFENNVTLESRPLGDLLGFWPNTFLDSNYGNSFIKVQVDKAEEGSL